MARPVLSAVLKGLRAIRGRKRVHTVDLGCSYGINAALLKRGMSLPELYAHYADPGLAQVDPATLAERDKLFYGHYPPSDDLRITGIDAAGNAVAYAERTGLVDRGAAADLENAAPSPEMRALLADADAVVSTGCVGYVTRVTFEHLLAAAEGERPPWVASFVLRIFPYDDIADTLSGHGLFTEKLEGVLFPQRRFTSAEERAETLATLRDMKLDPSDLEDRHGFLAEFYLSRPPDEARQLPLRELISADAIPADAISIADGRR